MPRPRANNGAAEVADFDAALAGSDDPWLTPVRVVWLPVERDGERAVRFRDVALSVGDPRHPHARWQRRLARTHPERCRVVVGEPARVSALRQRWAALSGLDPDVTGFAQFVRRQATLALERAETRLVGEQYKVPRLVREELLSTARFRSGLTRLAGELGRGEPEVTAEATSYLEEMVTGWSRLLVDLYVRLGRFNFRRGYDPELDLDAGQVARLQETAQRYPLVFLPSHKSNLDTLVMNVALHDSRLPRTHVFGGINMAFWPVGPLFRRAGTIYIRRTTRDSPVYTFALREYIAYLVDKRFSLQFYMEGGRSRTGKLLPPRLGLLAYVVDAYLNGDGEDIVLVPVSIAYDQLQEVGDFAREARGGSKSGESIRWLVRALREQRGRFGQIYVRFGEPLSLRSALGGADGRSPEAGDGRPEVQKIALEVSRRINEATPITATSMVTLSLLGAQGRALTVDQVLATVHDPLEYAIRRGLPLARQMDVDSPKGVLRVLAELERHNVVMRYAAGPEPVFAIGPDQHLAAAFYRNSVIHFFLHGALAQCALARAAGADVTDPVSSFWDASLSIRDLLKFEFFFEPREAFRATVAAEMAFHDPDWERRVAMGGGAVRELLEQMRPLTAPAVLRSFLEANAVAAAVLTRRQADPLEERPFLSECLALGRQYQLQQRILSPESLSKPLFANSFKLAASRGLLGPDSDSRAQSHFVEEVRAALRDLDVIASLLTNRVRSLINAEPRSLRASDR